MNNKVKRIFVNPFTISIVAVIALAALMIIGTLYWLDSYTNHDTELVVPDLKDLSESEAAKMLKDKHLYCEVVDSVFMKGKKPGNVVDQTPVAGAKVKAERTIYLVINARSPRKVALPDLKDVSVRQAEAILNSIGLRVEGYEYVPSIYKDLVEDVKYDRKVMLSGERVNEGSAVTLCVGMGPGNEIVPIVSLRGLSLDQAIDKAHSASLNIGSINYDVQPNSELDKTLYVVYKQMPITGKEVSMGQPVTLFLTKDKKLLDTPEEVYIDSSAVQPKEDDLFAQ